MCIRDRDKGGGLSVNLQQLSLDDIGFSKIDKINGSELFIHLEEGKIRMDEMDIHEPRFAIKTVILTKPTVDVINYNGTAIEDSTIVEVLSEDIVPTDGPLFLVDEFLLTDGKFNLTNYRKGPIPPSEPEQINFQQLRTFDILSLIHI